LVERGADSGAPTRRGFLERGTKAAAAVSLSAASYRRLLGANDRVGVGFIGFGLIGAQHVHDFKNQRDVDLVAMSDVYQARREQGVAAATPGRTRGYADFRKLLDDGDVNAVVISTPDHWHALAAMLACAAGKDVYVEKPLTLFVAEGRWLARAAKKFGSVVQVGTQQRSGPHFSEGRELLRGGIIGKVHSVRMSSFRNIMPGFGHPPPGAAVPAGFNYDLWLGPAPARKYEPHRGLYHFRWFWDYSGGQMTNLGAHSIDVAQWFLGVDGPLAVSSIGGRFALEDDGETPDTQDAILEYPGCTAVWSHREASAGRHGGGSIEFYGTKGSMIIGRHGFEVFPDTRIEPENAIPTFQGQPAGGPKRVAPAAGGGLRLWTESRKGTGSEADQLERHTRNFLDAVKTRQPTTAGVEDGHRVATTCHLANISLRLKRKLVWDAAREQVVGDAEANAMLTRAYRAPWDAALKGLSL
jgi:predicted dehydrogenase